MANFVIDNEFCFPLDYSYSFKNFRKKYGFSQTVLAEILGVSRNTVSDIECRKTFPSGNTVAAFLIVSEMVFEIPLGVNLSYFKSLLKRIDDLSITYHNYGDFAISDSLSRLCCELDYYY